MITAAVAILRAGGWPTTPSNVLFMSRWITAETPSGLCYNWLGVMAGYGQDTHCQSNAGAFQGAYPGWSSFSAGAKGTADAIKAIVPDVATMLAAGKGACGNPGALDHWNGNTGYGDHVCGLSPAAIGHGMSSSSGQVKGVGTKASGQSSGACSTWQKVKCALGPYYLSHLSECGPCTPGGGLTNPISSMLGKIGRWLEVGGGGAIMAIGLGVVIYGTTGRKIPLTAAAVGAVTGGPAGAALGAISNTKSLAPAIRERQARRRAPVQAKEAERQELTRLGQAHVASEAKARQRRIDTAHGEALREDRRRSSKPQRIPEMSSEEIMERIRKGEPLESLR